MGDYWPKEWTEQELQMMRDCPQHRIYTLTKQPQNLPGFSPFPDNCWVGVSATNAGMWATALMNLSYVEARVKYISIEPYLGMIIGSELDLMLMKNAGLNWVIIGAMTCKASDILHRGDKYPGLTALPWGGKWTLQPKIEWVEEIVRACDKAGIPVFEKNSLMPLVEQVFGRENYLSPILTPDGDLRQELPTTKV
ncbi:hypothetical protein ES708_19852 [subsurface metagenome]